MLTIRKFIKAGKVKSISENSVIDQEKANLIREMIGSGYNQFQIADYFNVNQCTISRVLNRKRRYSVLK